VLSGIRTPTPPIAPPHRIPSRAAVLHASTSRSLQPASPPTRPRSTPLEHFLATHPKPPPIPLSSEPIASTSQTQRSVSFSSTSSTRSRKGKERATPSPVQIQPRRNPRTPKRWSVELAPENSAIFAEEIPGLEVQGEVELDLEESGDMYWDRTEVEDSVYPGEGAGLDPAQSDRYKSSMIPPEIRPRTREATPVSPQLREPASTRLTRILSQPTPPPQPPEIADTSLPALPEPESEADDECDSRTLSSRRASMFRSSPRVERDSVASIRNQSSRTTSRYTQKSSAQPKQQFHSRDNIAFAPPEPVRVGMTFDSTPTKHAADQTISGATPHPPGRWINQRLQESTTRDDSGTTTYLTPTKPGEDQTVVGQTPHPPGKWQSPGVGKNKSGVRFSPLRQEVPVDESSMMSSLENTSVLRLKVSPGQARTKTPPKQAKIPSPSPVNPDTSLLSRLKTSISLPSLSSPSPIKPRLKHKTSQTLKAAQTSLSLASQASKVAQERVEVSQRQWVEAIRDLPRQRVVEGVVEPGWRWGGWVWWVSLELVLVWSVFRLVSSFSSSGLCDI
jgi:hypothetical protein